MTRVETARKVVAIGPESMMVGWSLAGVALCPAQTPDEVRVAWQTLPASVGVVVLAREAADVLGASLRAPDAPITVVVPP